MCNTFIKAGNWYGRTWQEITRGDEPERKAWRGEAELLAEREASGDKIDSLLNSDDEQLDVDESDPTSLKTRTTPRYEVNEEQIGPTTNGGRFFDTRNQKHFPSQSAVPAVQTDGLAPRKRPRSPSTASIGSVTDVQHDEDTTDMKDARLARSDGHLKRIKLASKPAESVNMTESSTDSPFAARIQSMVPPGGIHLGEIFNRLQSEQDCSVFMQLLRKGPDIEFHAGGMVYLKDDPACPRLHDYFFEDNESSALSTSNDSSTRQQQTPDERRSRVPLGPITRPTVRKQILGREGDVTTPMALVRDSTTVDRSVDQAYSNRDLAGYKKRNIIPAAADAITTQRTQNVWGGPQIQEPKLSVGTTDSGVPTLLLRPGQPATTKFHTPATINTNRRAAPVALSQQATPTAMVSKERRSRVSQRSTTAAILESQPDTQDRIHSYTASSIDKGKGKARASPSEQFLNDVSSAAIQIKVEDENGMGVTLKEGQHTHTSPPYGKPSSTRAQVNEEVEDAQRGLADALNDSLLTDPARSAITNAEDPGSDEVINATMDGSFTRAVNSATFSFEAKSQHSEANSPFLSSSNARNAAKVDGQTSVSSSSTSSNTGPTLIDVVRDATVLRLRHTLAAQSDRIATLLANNRESLRREHEAVTQLVEEQRRVAELEAQCQRVRAKLSE